MLPPGLVELLSVLGANFVSDTIIDTAGRLRRRRNADATALDEAALRDALADALHRALAGPDEQARQAPAQMGQVLRRVDAIGEALLASEQATDAVRADVYRALHALAAEFSDQTWILDDLRVGVTGMQQQLGDIERGQTEQLNLIRGVMLRIVERGSPPRWDDEVGRRGGTAARSRAATDHVLERLPRELTLSRDGSRMVVDDAEGQPELRDVADGALIGQGVVRDARRPVRLCATGPFRSAGR